MCLITISCMCYVCDYILDSTRARVWFCSRSRVTITHSFMSCTLSAMCVGFYVAHICYCSRACQYNTLVLTAVVGLGVFVSVKCQSVSLCNWLKIFFCLLLKAYVIETSRCIFFPFSTSTWVRDSRPFCVVCVCTFVYVCACTPGTRNVYV